METKNIERKLEHAYHNMVESLEHLVMNEGKTLKEGLQIAEQKLFEWEELSNEEVTKIKGEVINDLAKMGEVAESIRKSFHEKLELDELYLKDVLLDKLSKIANQSTFDIIEFRETLKKQAEEASEQLHEDEHHDHQQMESEHALWLNEITLWQKEHQEAEEKLLAILDTVRENAVALQEHAQTIRAHQLTAHQHEATMALVEKDQTSEIAEEKNETNEQAHERMAYTHKNQARLHQKIKEHHRQAMVLIEKLYKLVKA